MNALTRTRLAACATFGLAAILPQAAHAQYTLQTFNDPKGTNGTIVYGVNASGAAVGGYTDSASQGHAFVETGGTFTDYNGPAGFTNVGLNGINNAGQIVGNYDDPTAPGATSLTYHGFVATSTALGTTYTTIDAPGEVGRTVAAGISNSGVVAGYYFNSNGNAIGFTDTGGVFATFSVPNTYNTFVEGINNAGQVVGYYIPTSNSYARHAFVYNGSTFTFFDDPSGIDNTYGLGINDAGQIVGTYTDTTGTVHGFLDSGGAFTTINGPNATQTVARSISSTGLIVGNYGGSGNPSGFLDTPAPAAAPEPSQFAAFAVGLLGLGALAIKAKRRTA